MPRRKAQIRHAQIVQLFAVRLREVRLSRGMTQVDLAQQAQVTVTYISRLESAGAAPGIDLVDRLAKALGTTVHDLLPLVAAPNRKAVLLNQAKRLFESLAESGDQETLQVLNPLLARLAESASRHR
jgi:transcriptional regulator with XRE-family HTH domain